MLRAISNGYQTKLVKITACRANLNGKLLREPVLPLSIIGGMNLVLRMPIVVGVITIMTRKNIPQPQVGSYKPNPYGLYDMLGNVWQWTDGCREGDCAKLVLRGGSFEYEPEYLTARYREGIEATERINNLGFRLARTLP